MEWTIQDLGALGEFVGAFGVIASLLFVGFQVRQYTRAVRSEIRLGLADAMYHNHADAAMNADMSRIILSGVNEPQAMTEADRQRWIWWFDGFYHMLGGCYHEYQEGQLSDEFQERFDSWIAGQMELELFRKSWESERLQNRFTESFRQHVDNLIANPPESAWRWKDSADVFGDR